MVKHNTIKLSFPSLSQLWAFAEEVKVTTMEIFEKEKILNCACKEEDVKLAQEKYEATIIESISVLG